MSIGGRTIQITRERAHIDWTTVKPEDYPKWAKDRCMGKKREMNPTRPELATR